MGPSGIYNPGAVKVTQNTKQYDKSAGLVPGINFGAIWDKFVKGNKAADILPGVNFQANTSSTGGTTIAPAPTIENVASDNLATSFTGSGSGTGRVAPTAAQTNPLYAALESAGTVKQNALNEAQSLFDRNMKAYADENTRDRENYDKQVGQNESNLAANRQAALLQAAQGGQGLRSILASLGALSGTGSVLANRAVSQAANKDIGDATKSFNTSAETLNTAWADTERQQRQRENDARAALTNDQRSAESNFATSRQNILTQLANLFGADTAQGGQYASEAASLYPTIAANSARATGSYAAPSSLYSNQALDAYKGGVRDLTVETTAGNTVDPSSSLFSPTGLPLRRREEELA